MTRYPTFMRMLLLPILVLFPALALAQSVYSYIDDKGVRILTNIPPQQDFQAHPAGPALQMPRAENKQPARPKSVDRSRFNSIIEKYAPIYRLDPSLVRSMIETESNFNEKAVSPKGAQGLMQLMPATAARVGVRNPFDPDQNIRGGMQHMRNLLDMFGNDLILSLAAYNAGENLVQRLGRVPHIRETHDYVRSITRRYGNTSMTVPEEDTPRSPAYFRYRDENGVLHLTNIAPVERGFQSAP